MGTYSGKTVLSRHLFFLSHRACCPTPSDLACFQFSVTSHPSSQPLPSLGIELTNAVLKYSRFVRRSARSGITTSATTEADPREIVLDPAHSDAGLGQQTPWNWLSFNIGRSPSVNVQSKDESLSKTVGLSFEDTDACERRGLGVSDMSFILNRPWTTVTDMVAQFHAFWRRIQ